ncbi:hypothetical protein F0562_011992 [Nyssa sinensis]|uniref:Glutamyl-tRNA(Gln) amidotransferase subunit C, chloroplastic/mitochondrial n=1 Tax=Nyssa sinensis TaxID=561372 RepID=A0A5J4ZTB0_9ASTE|nr:hypothetical protein F0562_011992 [Nyssa sinensis]
MAGTRSREVPPDTGSVSSLGKKMAGDRPIKKKNPTAVKISPWTLARLNSEDVSKVAVEVKKKSKIIQSLGRQEAPFALEADGSFGSSGRRLVTRSDKNNRRRGSKRVCLPVELPLVPLANVSAKAADGNGNDLISETSTSLTPLQLEAQRAFQTSLTMSSSRGIYGFEKQRSRELETRDGLMENREGFCVKGGGLRLMDRFQRMAKKSNSSFLCIKAALPLIGALKVEAPMECQLLVPTIRMGSRALLLLRATGQRTFNFRSSFSKALTRKTARSYSACSGLQPPDIPRLAETARISLNPDEVEEFAPKIQHVVNWFGQLQAIDLQSIEPAIRADTEGDNLRDDLPETFENREAMIAAVPSYEEPYIKVPKVLNKE